jgi:hypothetical protein
LYNKIKIFKSNNWRIAMAASKGILIVQGEDRDLPFGVKDIEEDVYIDITTATAISVNGTPVEFTMAASEVTITDGPKGKFSVKMSDTKTALMKLGALDLEVVIDFGSDRRIIQSKAVLNIVKALF